MSTSIKLNADQILTAALALPVDERVELAERIWNSLPEMPAEIVDSKTAQVIAERVAAVHRGDAKSMSLDEAMKRLRPEAIP